MRPTRRTLLQGITALGSLPGCSFTSSLPSTDTSPASTPASPPTRTAAALDRNRSEPPLPWNPPGTVDDATFACAIQTGDVWPTASLVSIRQFHERELELVLARGTQDGWQEVRRIAGLVPVRNVVQLELTDLVPDTTYAVVFYAPGGQRRSPPARFRTALAEGTSRTLRFGATSCLGSPGAPWRSMGRVATQKLDFFVLLGDTIYADEGLSPAGHWAEHWTNALSTEGLRDLSLSTSLIATWDDHEVNNSWNWEDDGALVPEALQAYRDALPQRVGPSGGIWRNLRWGDALEIFVLDCRSERVGGAYLSAEQLNWLMQGLSASRARFKIILNSVPITDLTDVYFGSDDIGWNAYPSQREKILDHIDSLGITGVLWLTGDVHWGAIATVGKPRARGAGQYEVFCGPAGSRINALARRVKANAQFDAVYFAWNSVTFEADPVAGTIVVTVEGDTGPILSRTLQLIRSPQ